MEILLIILILVTLVLLGVMNYYCNKYENASKLNKAYVDQLFELENERNAYRKQLLETVNESKNKDKEIEKLNTTLKDLNNKLLENTKKSKTKITDKDIEIEVKDVIEKEEKPKKKRTKKTDTEKEEKKTTTKRTRKTKKTKEDK